MIGQLASEFTVHWVNRHPGLERGTMIADMASDYAAAIEADLDRPVDVVGISTGGPIAIQLALDYPNLVKRLVLVSTGYRLSEYGRRIQRRMMQHFEAGDFRRGWAVLGTAMGASPPSGWAMATMMWLFGGMMTPSDPNDVLRTLEAEDRFDAGADLHRIVAPTLIVTGGKDRLYDVKPTEREAWIPNCRVVTYPNKGHMGAGGSKTTIEEIKGFLD